MVDQYTVHFMLVIRLTASGPACNRKVLLGTGQPLLKIETMKNVEENEENNAGVIYETISIKEMEYEEADSMFYYPCPCGDLFELSRNELITGLRVATCPSCSLQISVIVTAEELENICASHNKLLKKRAMITV